MRYSAAFVIASASALVAAQTTASSSGYTCAAQTILDTCLGQLKPRIGECPQNDWDCLCSTSTDVLTCYNNCPGYPDQFGAQQTQISYCNAAQAYGSSALAKTASTTATGAAASTPTAAITTTAAVEAAATPASKTTNGATPAASTDAAANLQVSALIGGGLFAALFL